MYVLLIHGQSSEEADSVLVGQTFFRTLFNDEDVTGTAGGQGGHLHE